MFPSVVIALALAAPPSAADARSLSFVHMHVDESLTVTYFENGRYRPDALVHVSRFLRDWRTGEVVDIDPKLLDLLWELKNVTGSREPFQVICGHRSAATNDKLRRVGGAASGVAKESQHLLGRAIDIRLADVPSARLREAALALASGGVGYYEKSDFVHIDTGRVRRW